MGYLLKYVEGGLKIWNACCHQETLEQDNIETNKLRTRRLGNKGMRISRFLAVFRFFEVKKWPLRVQWESGVKFGG